jgi:ATP-binding cassette, subfamily C (CFTR/MRP), member 1
MLNSAIACFDRIESFLKSDARRDDRLPLLSPPEIGKQSISSISSIPTDIELDAMPPTVDGSKINSTVMIVTHNASFSWDINAQPAVSDLSFILPRHQFCFIIGPVGSGKSTMLKGLLGETPASMGIPPPLNLSCEFLLPGHVLGVRWLARHCHNSQLYHSKQY